jgi:hypothetical protein
MPTVLRSGPYRYYFYAGDAGEPPHVHIERDDCMAKFWLQPVRLVRSNGFARVEIDRLRRLTEDNQIKLMEKWNEYFNG